LSEDPEVKLKIKKMWQLLVLLSLTIVGSYGYKTGAPVVACDTMTPGHNVEAQVGPSRHSFTTR